MLKRFFQHEPSKPIEPLIDAVVAEMEQKGPDSDDYERLLAYLERLNEIKAKNRQEPVSRDTIALIAGNFLGIVAIVAYEQKHVMTSKAFGWITRPRVQGTIP